ncbi:MAG: dihydropteroate synthase [Deltaproteobacteria bacterium]|jgi:dihydropteroate synthase|nr:dihydropteroate synthase [Deltaproteobacteria bacterium]
MPESLKLSQEKVSQIEGSSQLVWTIENRTYALDFSQVVIMGIINLTPDSFSDGGLFFEAQAAINQAKKHLAEGALILDLGAETTRPGSLPTPLEEEWRRLEPVLTTLAAWPEKPIISVDTNKAEIARRALLAGAALVNDVYAARNDPAILEVCAKFGAPIILMHMLGQPRTMQVEPRYDDVVGEVRAFLLERALAAMKAGVPREKIFLDPGLGFGKNADHNLTLIKHFAQVIPPGFRRVMALSRKAFLGKIIKNPDALKRDAATATATAISVLKGAEIVRVHNVAPSLEAIEVALAIDREGL